MEIKYNIPKLEKIISGLSTLTGITINFCDTNGKTLIRTTHKQDFCSAVQSLEENLQKCRGSDAEIFNKCKQSQRLEHHICYAGLCDFAMPIMKSDVLVGYVIMGRMRTPDSAYTYTPSVKFETLFQETPFFTYEKIDCLKDLLPQILFENAIEIEHDSTLSLISDYIKTHLHETLTIECICNKFHVSKNTLYDSFRTGLNCTVNEFISGQRLRKAKQLLSETSEPVYRIAEMVGIDNYTYFCKLFKRKEGITPSAYRKG